jgi:LmbE family N-acetylglucosaminyl deacetylase
MNFKNVLIVSAHADDETFGMGATISKMLKNGIKVHWLIMSKVWEPRWTAKQVRQRNTDIQKVNQFFKFNSILHWEFPDNKMDTVSLDEYQKEMIGVLESIKPDTIFCPGLSDWNKEHQIAFDVVEMSTKPIYSPYIRDIYTYEIPSSTDWTFKSVRNFKRNFYISFGESELDAKKHACELYTTEISQYPHPRSLEGVKTLAKTRGMEVGLDYAEAFSVMRSIKL